jgi:Na+/melibiose symporter-like transporter
MGGLTITGQQHGGFGGQRQQQMFGRVDPFCLFAVLPMLIITGLVFWGGLILLGVVLTLLTVLVVLVDSWANRPANKQAPRYRES